jgi:putative ABC transport system permease protein
MAASLDTALIVGTDDRAPERFQGTYISANMFRMLGDTPILGRDFTTEDEAANATPVVILGSAVWKARFGADRALLGRTVRINDVPTVVIGIMPDGFKFPYVTDGWQPLTRLPGLATQKRDVRTLNVFARLRDGTTINQAQTELATIAGRLTHDHPDTNKNVVPVIVTRSEYMQGGPLRTILLTLMGTVVFVLLIACANIANLMLARAANRAQEITIRITLGAPQWRIIQQLLVECVLLTTVASTVGFALAAYSVRLFALGDKEGTLDQQPYWLHWTIDGRVVMFLIMVSFAATLLFGLVPAPHIARSNTHAGLEDTERAAMSTIRASRWTSVLMIIEPASTVVLLAGAGLMGRSFLALSRAETVMSTADVLTMRLTMPIRKYQTADQRKDFFERLENTVRSTPGVAAVAVATWLPFGGAETRQLAIFGQPDIPDKPPLISYVYMGRSTSIRWVSTWSKDGPSQNSMGGSVKRARS